MTTMPTLTRLPLLVKHGCVARHTRQLSKAMSTTTHVIDLRSDAKTRPTPQMRQAMKYAVVGDDDIGEDPTSNELQRVFAEKLGKEAALFVPTCTMANTIAVLVHCDGRFNEIILGSQSYIHRYDVSAVAQFGGIQGRVVRNLPDGTMDLHDIEDSVRVTEDVHQPWTKLVCLENTHNLSGGKIISVDYTEKVRQLTDKHNLKLHLDGARLFNASVALGVPVSEIAAPAHSVSLSLTKGLCCPVGSLIVGSHDFIYLARRARKALGGGMRQAGVIAAPALVALDSMVDRLKDDHRRARQIARAVESVKDNPVCRVTMDGIHTNIVMIELIGKVTPEQFATRMRQVTEIEKKALGESISVLMLSFTSTTVRYVTHHDIYDDDVIRLEKKMKYVIEDLSRQS